ncbi:unnamed protein product [Periconia digitata]|uniref:Uncharacterized protein n=1 Tax=Periconia digitata TaxID=1303443 RepID=A0A9W4XWD9_9PLEO|nr:unnamed protein product [Periconia digitata]
MWTSTRTWAHETHLGVKTLYRYRRRGSFTGQEDSVFYYYFHLGFVFSISTIKETSQQKSASHAIKLPHRTFTQHHNVSETCRIQQRVPSGVCIRTASLPKLCWAVHRDALIPAICIREDHYDWKYLAYAGEVVLQS